MRSPKRIRHAAGTHPDNHVPPHTEVYVLRDFQEYLGESALIVFSVLLALFVTEIVNYFHDKSETKDVLENVRLELVKNLQAEKEQYAYQTMVLKNIDSALKNPEFQTKVFAGGEFRFYMIAPDGVLYRDLNKVAWQVAQSKGIITKIKFPLVEKLTNVYDQQARIDKLEDEVAAVFFRQGSGKQENARETLIGIRNNYRGWAYDRAPDLLKQYAEAIKMIEED